MALTDKEKDNVESWAERMYYIHQITLEKLISMGMSVKDAKDIAPIGVMANIVVNVVALTVGKVIAEKK